MSSEAAGEYRARLVKLWRHYLPHHSEKQAAERIDDLLGRKRLRPVDVANTVVGAKFGLRPSRVQRLASSRE